MAQFVNFTDIDGLIIKVNPEDIVSIYASPSNPLVTIVRLIDGGKFLSSQTIAALETLFGITRVVGLDPITLAALESITVQNPGGASAVNIQDGGNSITVDGTVALSGGTITVNQGTSPWVVNSTGLTDAQLRATPVPVSGTITVSSASVTQGTSPWVSSLDAPTLAALESITVQNPAGAGAVNIQDGGNSITVDGSVGIIGTVPVLGPLTDAQLRATAVPVSGTITVNQGTSPWVTSVSGSVAVTGPLTDAQLRATAVPVSGPLTDTQLRATPVPISGTVTVTDGSGPLTVDGSVSITGSVAVTGPLTDAQLRATAVPVSGTVAVTQSTSPWIISDQFGTIANGAETTVSSTAVQILASNASRKKYVIQNTGTANIRVGITGVTATTGARVVPNGSLLFEMPNCPTQAIFAIREGLTDSIAFAQEVV